MKLCYVLSYRAPQYIRTRSILRALRETAGIEVFEAINQSTNAARYYETFRKAREIKEQFDPDVYLLGFRGHEFYWALRRLVGKKPIILDALMSPYASLSRERKFRKIGAIAAMGWKSIERSVLNNADLVLTDTLAHCRLYEHEFSLASHKLLSIPVGAEEQEPCRAQLSYEAASQSKQQMTALFYGSFLPLHGVDVILEAASRLRDLPIRFDFIGGDSRQHAKLVTTCAKLEITRYTHTEWVEFDELINTAIPNADICLGGPFGNTEQARRVITGKTSQCLALGKPTIIGEIDEEHGFVDKQNCLLVPQGKSEALAAALRWAYNNQQQLAVIGERGRAIYAEKLSIKVIGNLLGQAISDLVPKK
jgi:glycosyltransferase involved in cell wall biosynthesis